MEGAMDHDKSILEKIAATVKAAAESIAHPTAGTPMEMPLNESGYAITHLKSAPQAKQKAPAKRAPKKIAKKSPKKSKSSAGRKAVVSKKTAKKVAKKKKPKKSRR
jgi:hypothetical protein